MNSSLEVSTDKSDHTKLLEDTGKQNTHKHKKIYIGVIVTCGCIIFTLLMLNLWQAGYFDSSESETELNIIECSGNGHKFNDLNVCECYSCFSGTNCEVDGLEDCMIEARSGSPEFLVEYWSQQRNNIKPLSIAVDYRTPYGSHIGPYSENDTAENRGLGGDLNQIIRRIHSKYHNVNTTASYLVFGDGATGLETAAYYAWSKLKGKPIVAYDEIPYYGGYKSMCAAAGSLSQCTFNGTFPYPYFDPDDIVEYVVIPNNPDGFVRERTYKNATAWGYDLVYNWPHYFDSADELQQWDAPVSFFSLTKLTGHAATRFGWAFVKDYQLASEMRLFVGSHPVEAAARAYQLLSYLEEHGEHYFDFVRKRLKERWDLLLEVMNMQNQERYISRGRAGTFFAWIECVDQMEQEIMDLWHSYNLDPRPGSWFGVFGTPGFVRLGIAALPEPNFQQMIVQLRLLFENET